MSEISKSPWARLLSALVAVLVVSSAGCAVTVETVALSDTSQVTVESASDGAESSSAGPAEPLPAAASPTRTPTAVPVQFEVSDEWPPVLREYVGFVQQTRGEEYELIADIEFVDPQVLIDEFSADLLLFDDLSAESKRIVLYLDDVYRALGLSNREFNVLEGDRSVLTNVAAYYKGNEDVIVFPSSGGAELTEIPLVDRPLIVHELGHALQKQDRFAWSDQIEDTELALAMLEGEAEWLYGQYLRTLSATEFQAWTEALPDPVEPSGVPEILESGFATSYTLGSRFFYARYALDGLNGINRPFQDASTVTSQMLLDPWLFTGDTVRQETFDYFSPDEQDSGEAIGIAWDFPLSAVDWHQIFGAAMSGPQALRAARSVNSYTVPSGWIDNDGRVCFSIWVSSDPTSGDALEAGLAAWVAVASIDRRFEFQADSYYVAGCDPGAGDVPEPRATPLEVLAEAALVIDTETWAVEQGLAPDDGFCLGWDLVRAFDDDEELDFYGWFDALDHADLPTDC